MTLLIVCFTVATSNAAETSAIDESQVVSAKVKLFKAADRLEHVKSLLRENPNMDMNTKHPSIYADFYKRDLAYIKQQRANDPELIDILDGTDVKFTGEFRESISFADLNFIAEN